MSEYWVSTPKKQCEYCKCWIADNRPSIDFHERGKNHQENVRKKLADVRKKSALKREEDATFKSEFAKMEADALKAMKKDLASNVGIVGAADMKVLARPKTAPEDACPTPSKKEKSELAATTGQTTVGQATTAESGPWEKHTAVQGHSYYYNKETGESTWKKPKEFKSSKTDTNSKTGKSEMIERNPHTMLGSWTTVPVVSSTTAEASDAGDQTNTAATKAKEPQQEKVAPVKFKEKTLRENAEDDNSEPGNKVEFKKRNFKGRRTRQRDS